MNPTVWVDPDGRIAELRALQERIRAKKAEIIAGAASISDAVFGEDTVLGNLAGRAEAKIKGSAAGALGLVDRGVGFLNFSANVGAATALGSDNPIAQEAALELEESIESTIESVKAGVSYVVEHPSEAASAAVKAVASTSGKLASGDPETIAKVQAFKTEILAEVLLSKGAGTASSAARRSVGSAADAVKSLNRTSRARSAVRAANEAAPSPPPALLQAGVRALPRARSEIRQRVTQNIAQSRRAREASNLGRGLSQAPAKINNKGARRLLEQRGFSPEAARDVVRSFKGKITARRGLAGENFFADSALLSPASGLFVRPASSLLCRPGFSLDT